MDEAAQEAVATARAFAQAANAVRVVLLIDRGEHETALLVELDGDSAEVTDGDVVSAVGASIAASPRPLEEIRAIPHTAIRLDLQTGELSAPIGAIEHLAQSLKALAGAFGGRTVATAEFATADAHLPITIAAREGEPAILSAAGDQYVLPV